MVRTIISIWILLIANSALAQVSFREIAAQVGIRNKGFNYGVSAGDYDGDGDEDLYITQINGRNLLYRNLGNGSYDEVAEQAGVDYAGETYMAVWGDLDNDGDLDLYLGTDRYETNKLYINDGSGHFSDMTEASGTENVSKTRSVLMADVDNDGYLDIYLFNYKANNALFHNNGDGTFTNLIDSSGANDLGIAMGAVFFDYDNDGDQDLYLTHDDYEPNVFFRNDGNNTFTDQSVEAGINYSGLGMGVDAADFNNDGYLDLYITNMLENVLYLNNGDGTFTDVTEEAGVGDDGMGWGVTWIDYNYDGWEDIYLVNDSDFFPDPNILYHNNGDGTFTNISDESVLSSWFEGYGVARGDLNGDGLEDLLVTNKNIRNQLFLNNSPTGNWLRIKFTGSASNRNAVGARVVLYTGEKKLTKPITAGSGYSSQNSLTLQFGLGDAQQADSVIIYWPGAEMERLTELPSNTYLSVQQGQGVTDTLAIDPGEICTFEEILNSESGLPGYNNGIAAGDFDNDGDDDLYVSRLNNEPNLLYENLGDGNFQEIAASKGLDSDKNTITSVWGDVNNDGWLDLYIGNDDDFDELHLNNGDGTFTDITQSAKIANAKEPRSVNMADIDGDGDLDIYLSNIKAQNIMYRNNGDLTFSNITTISNTKDSQVAMGSIFFDYDNDGDQDLYLTHDARQANILYENDGAGKFTDVSEVSGTDFRGFGMGVDVADINNDGWLDIYITNLYENTLLLNNGDKTFTDISESADVQDYGMGWGLFFFDFDNDGWVDIYSANNSYFSPYSNVLYRNSGNNTFSLECTDQPVSSFYGAYGTASLDFNRDGFVDVAVANTGKDGNELFENTGIGNQWIGFDLRGAESNYFAVGARIQVISGIFTYTDEVNAGAGYASQNSYSLHFGLGPEESADTVRVTWPSGLVETFTELPAGAYYTLLEGEGVAEETEEEEEDPEEGDVITSLPEEDPELQVELFPNPFTSYFVVRVNTNQVTPFQLQLRGMNGSLVSVQEGKTSGQGAQEIAINPQIPNGMYIYELELGNQKVRGKIIKF